MLAGVFPINLLEGAQCNRHLLFGHTGAVINHSQLDPRRK